MAYLDLATFLKAYQSAWTRFSDKQPDKEAGILKPTIKEERPKAALKRKIPTKD